MSRILIVEDEAHLAQGLRFNFEAEGYTVQTTDRGEDALTRLTEKKEQFDVLVLDVMLPGKDGFEVARELREAKNYIPLLMLTARGRPEDVLKGFEAGADDYLPKPFNLAILIARVESLLRRKNWAHNAINVTADRSQQGTEPPDIFRFDDKEVDFRNLQLRIGEKIVQLTVMETRSAALSHQERRTPGFAKGYPSGRVESARRNRHSSDRQLCRSAAQIYRAQAVKTALFADYSRTGLPIRC